MKNSSFISLMAVGELPAIVMLDSRICDFRRFEIAEKHNVINTRKYFSITDLVSIINEKVFRSIETKVTTYHVPVEDVIEVWSINDQRECAAMKAFHKAHPELNP